MNKNDIEKTEERKTDNSALIFIGCVVIGRFVGGVLITFLSYFGHLAGIMV